MVKIGHKIPDFELDAFQGEEIKNIRLSDYKGRWLILFLV